MMVHCTSTCTLAATPKHVLTSASVKNDAFYVHSLQSCQRERETIWTVVPQLFKERHWEREAREQSEHSEIITALSVNPLMITNNRTEEFKLHDLMIWQWLITNSDISLILGLTDTGDKSYKLNTSFK